ncbi:MAG: helix-turn-helix transcriptional regulator [Sinobacteraceae bacterium]|nr:helix-turn-helix transcriptional regulator [Nevskiaceae bacterium]
MDASTRPLVPLDVALIDVPAGRIEPAPDPYHLLDLHASEPVRAAIRLDGRESRETLLYGDINIVPAGSTGRWLLEARASALLLRLAPSLFDEAAAAMNLKPVGLALRPAVCVRDPHIEHIGWMIKNERLAGYPSGSVWLESAAYAVALRLVRRSHNSSRVPRSFQQAMPKWRLSRVHDYIEANLDRDLTLRELAAVAGFSVPHFKVLFRNALGLPVHRYVVERRVEYARQLILQGERPMANIALDAGFAHQSHMIRCMQRVLGIRPAEVVALARGSSGSRSFVPAGPQ